MEQKSRLVIEIDSRNAERNATAIARELQNIERNGDYATKSTDQFSSSIRSLTGYMAGFVTVGTAVSKMDLYTGLENRLKLVTDSQIALNVAMSDTFKIAQGARQEWETITQVYQRFSDNAKTLGIDMAKTAALTDTVAKAVAISGASTQAAEAALVQFGQALASGVLRGEELNSVMEQTPGLAKAIAQGMGLTVGQLRSVAAEGKITSAVLVDALTKSKDSVDELFSRTDVTIGQSLTVLSNEVTKFTGEAGKASGAAAMLSGGILTLSNNLDSIANIAVLGGVALLTKAIVGQMIAVRGSITASIQRRAADTALAESQVRLAALEVQRTRQAAALALTEVNLARAEYNSASKRNERALATQRLTAAEIALSVAEKQSAIATTASTAAQNALNASRAIGARVLGLMGGPIGALTLGVTALAAIYMHVSSKTAEASAKLEEQGKIANKTTAELKALKGVELQAAKNDLAEAFEAENKKLKELNQTFSARMIAIQNANKGNVEVIKISNDVRQGLISQEEAIKRLNNLDYISPQQFKQLKDANTTYDEQRVKVQANADAQKTMGVEVKLAGNENSNAAAKVADHTKALRDQKEELTGVSKALSDYRKKMQDGALESIYKDGLLDKNYSIAQIDAIWEYQKAKGLSEVVTQDEINELLRTVKLTEDLKGREDAITEAKRAQTKELNKQIKATERLVGLVGSTGTSTGNHLDIRYDKAYSSGPISAEHMARFKLGGKTLDPKNSNSKYGMRTHPVTGKKALHRGYDFKAPAGTEVTTSAAVKDVKTYFDTRGGGYTSRVVFDDGVIVNLLHQLPEMTKKIKGGASKANSSRSSKDAYQAFLDQEKIAEEQAKSRKSLELEVANEVTKIRENLKDKLIEIDNAGFSPEDTARLKAEYQSRADNEIAIAEFALNTKLDDYADFQKSELQLLEKSYAQKMFYASRDIELSGVQKDKAVALLGEQLREERALLEIAKEQRIFQYKQALMTETKMMQERYRLEMLEKMKIADPVERKIAMESRTSEFIRGGLAPAGTVPMGSNIGKSNVQMLQEETGRELLEMKARYEFAQDAAKENADELLRIEREYIAAKEQLHSEHDVKMIDARQADHDNQLQVWGQLLNQGQNTWGMMTQAVKDANGEQSASFKTMFAMQQAFAIASTIVSAHLAASQTTADVTLPFVGKVPAASAILAFGYAQAGMIAAQTLAGFASGGYTGAGGKYDPAGIVHKGEVVWSQDDIKRWGGVDQVESMRQSAPRAMPQIQRERDTARVLQGGGQIAVQPKIIINTPPGTYAETSTDSEGAITIDIVRKEAASAASNAVKQSWNQVQNFNSHEAKQIAKSFNVTPKR